MRTHLRWFGPLLAMSSLVVVACGSSGESLFDTGGENGNDGTGGLGLPNDGSQAGFGGKPKQGKPPCTGLACKQIDCPGGGTTSLSGKVYDPSGTLPLYNAIVYVPNAPLEPFAPGVSCDKCGAGVSGKPITTALSNAKGDFVLKNVPVGVDIPLVVQIGRWRRQVTIPAAKQCADTPLPSASTRLPRNKQEGDIPHIAVTTGGADSIECLLRKIGIEDAEMTNPDQSGRVHIYQGLRSGANGSRIDASTPSGESLWDAPAELAKYDMVILSCEGAENNGTKSAAAKANVRDYLDKGGRVFASHFHYTFFKNGPADVQSTATWSAQSVAVNNSGPTDITVDTTYPKGKAFRDWLVEAQASTTPGVLPTVELRKSVLTVPGPGAPASASFRWLFYATGGAEDAKYYSFNAPVGVAPADQCGRGVFTDIHVSSGDASGGTFPANCTTTGLTPQEKALLFLLFDLASCIQDDTLDPSAPPGSIPDLK